MTVSLAPLVEEARARIDRDRELPETLGAALADAGLFATFAPREYGGLELDPVAGLRAVAAVAELDGSVAWNAMVAGAHSFFAGRLPQTAAREIYTAPRAAVAGQLQPGGRAEVTDGGYRASGRWSFASASKHATWFIAQCIVLENGELRAGRDRRPGLQEVPDLRLVFVPADRVRIHDTWHVSGLRGTGSNDYSIDEVDVPAEYTVDLLADEPTRPEPLYRFPAVLMLMGSVAAVPVGIARGAVEAFKDFARTKTASPKPVPMSESPVVQMELARAEIAARSAELLLFTAMEDVWETVRAGHAVSMAQRAQVRLGCVNAGTAAARAVDTVYNLAGSSAIFEKNPFERRFRDVHAATAHAAVHQRALEPCGQTLLGLEPQGVF